MAEAEGRSVALSPAAVGVARIDGDAHPDGEFEKAIKVPTGEIDTVSAPLLLAVSDERGEGLPSELPLAEEVPVAPPDCVGVREGGAVGALVVDSVCKGVSEASKLCSDDCEKQPLAVGDSVAWFERALPLVVDVGEALEKALGEEGAVSIADSVP